jgi:hypothetical protein
MKERRGEERKRSPAICSNTDEHGEDYANGNNTRHKKMNDP